MIEYLQKHAEKKEISFHMPGHKGLRFFERYGYGDFLKNLVNCDITELYGADNLQQPSGIIRKLETAYKKLYEVRKSFLLVNGSSAGIIASILAAVPPGSKLLMSRGSHKAAYNGVKLGAIEPIYVYPEMEKGIMGPISPKDITRSFKEHPDIKAVFITSPNYYGVCSNIQKIADICHKNNAILIVDQAHGAHLKFFHKFDCDDDDDMPMAAEDCGADIIINSIHKTLGSFTQSAIVNLNSGKIQPNYLRDKINMIQSTSPSYLLLASLDINRRIIEDYGPEIFREWKENIDEFYRCSLYNKELKIVREIKNFDKSKIWIDVESLDTNPRVLARRLRDENIFVEMTSENLVLCMTGIGNVRDEYEKLLDFLERQVLNKDRRTSMREFGFRNQDENQEDIVIPKPGERLQIEAEGIIELTLDNCVGEMSAITVTPYPPGIPIVVSGEIITEDHVEAILKCLSRRIEVVGIGIRNPQSNKFRNRTIRDYLICVYKKRG